MEPPAYVEPASYAIESRRWAPKLLARVWPHLTTQVPVQWLPRAPLLGCGGSGCVYATGDDAVVAKVTNDDTEIEFASRYAAHLSTICVKYLGMYDTGALEEERQVFLLFRESAHRVGELEEVLGAEASSYIHAIYSAGSTAYRSAKWINAKTIASLRKAFEADLRKYTAACDALSGQSTFPQLRELGVGLRHAFQQHGIVFGDFRAENLGLVHRDDGGHWVIIDPGSVAVVRR